jgi:curved DNA-binding protein CbpA
MENGHFTDLYETLQISSNADRETIDRVYRLLARRFHPDNHQTGDPLKFDALTKAYRILSDPEKRAEYDGKYESISVNRWHSFIKKSSENGNSEDTKIYQGILSVLFTARKSNTSRPGVGIFDLERLLGVPEKHLEFHIWYLKEKGWIQRDESGGYAITANGVDTE